MNVKFIAQLAGAAGVGGFYAWAWTEDRAERRARRMADDYVALVSDVQGMIAENIHLTTQLESANDRIDKLEHRLLADEPQVVPTEVSLRDVAEVTPELTEADIEAQTTELKELIAPYVADPQVQEDFMLQARAQLQHAAVNDPPMVISQDEFSHDEEGQDFEKLTIHFYKKYQTLLDEENEAIAQNEVENVVGWRSLRRFGDKSGQPDVVYVRNKRLQIDYEVVLMEGEDLPLHVQYNMDQPTFETMKKSGKLLLPGSGDDDG
jgi:hypothetical protein